MSTWSPWNETTSPFVWAVICKNHRFHNRQNFYSGHKIPLGETDEFTPPPTLDFRITVKCDECGEEHGIRSKRDSSVSDGTISRL
jgi:hypothetical protein